VHTLLLEEYGVSKKWVIIMDRRQDSNAASTLAGSGLLQCKKFRMRREETTWKRKRIETSLVIVMFMSRVITHTSHGKGDHRPLRLSGLPAAHTFFGMIPQSPAPYFTVHSVKCNWSAPSPSGCPQARNVNHCIYIDSVLLQDRLHIRI